LKVDAIEDLDKGHPAAPRLDAVAAGDEDQDVTEHLGGCTACAAYVSVLRAQAQAFRERTHGDAWVARTLAKERTRRRRAGLVAVAGPLVLAAAVALFLRGRLRQEPVVPTIASNTPFESGEMRFKGELSVVVIRERAGRQEQIVGSFGVRPLDAIRVEVSVDREGPLTAGLLTDEGDWIVLLAPTAVVPGMHFSERAARFDEKPTRATLLVGAPLAVDRARRTRDFAGLIAWRVTSEP
jgi:hypothetical protein